MSGGAGPAPVLGVKARTAGPGGWDAPPPSPPPFGGQRPAARPGLLRALPGPRGAHPAGWRPGRAGAGAFLPCGTGGWGRPPGAKPQPPLPLFLPAGAPAARLGLGRSLRARPAAGLPSSPEEIKRFGPCVRAFPPSLPPVPGWEQARSPRPWLAALASSGFGFNAGKVGDTAASGACSPGAGAKGPLALLAGFWNACCRSGCCRVPFPCLS